MSTLIVLALIGVIVSAVATVVAARLVFRDVCAQRSERGKKDVVRSGWLPLMLT